MRKTLSITAILISFILASPYSLAADILGQLKDCARIQKDDERIGCYEALGKSVLASDTDSVATPATPEPSATDATSAEPKELPDSIGGGKYARDAGVPEEQFHGLLKSCKKAIDKRWFYIFENGQVWKQVKHKKIRHKNCNVGATLTQDGFGYIMRIDGEDRKIRVRRHR